MATIKQGSGHKHAFPGRQYKKSPHHLMQSIRFQLFWRLLNEWLDEIHKTKQTAIIGNIVHGIHLSMTCLA